MKTKLITVTIAMLSLCAIKAQEVSSPSFYERFAVKGFGVAETQDFEEVEYGAGIGLTYEIVGNLRGNIETISFDTDHRFIDKGNIGLEFVSPITKSMALIPEGGVSRNFESDVYGFYVGLGIGGNITGGWDYFIKGRWLREENSLESRAGFLVGIQYNIQ